MQEGRVFLGAYAQLGAEAPSTPANSAALPGAGRFSCRWAMTKHKLYSFESLEY